MTQHDGHEVWRALMEDGVDRGEVVYLHPKKIAGFTVPATYWVPGAERHPHVALYDAAATLASACACRGRLHAACVWPTVKRGEPLDMPEDWHDWVTT